MMMGVVMTGVMDKMMEVVIKEALVLESCLQAIYGQNTSFFELLEEKKLFLPFLNLSLR